VPVAPRQKLCGAQAAHVRRHPEAACNGYVLSKAGLLDNAAKLLGRHERLPLIAIPQKHDELLTAPSEQHVPLTNVRLDEGAELGDDLVPGQMPERVVYFLEVVYVEYDDGARPFLALVRVLPALVPHVRSSAAACSQYARFERALLYALELAKPIISNV